MSIDTADPDMPVFDDSGDMATYITEHFPGFPELYDTIGETIQTELPTETILFNLWLAGGTSDIVATIVKTAYVLGLYNAGRGLYQPKQ